MQRLISTSLKLAAAFALTIAVAAPAKADLVVNGNFATGTFFDWTLSGDSSKDVIAGSPGAYSAALGTTVNSSGSYSFMAQSLTTVVGQTYHVSYDVKSDGLTPNSLKVFLGGYSLTNLSNLPATPGFVTQTADFTATATKSTLLFQVQDKNGFLNLTNISVIPAAVPEPSAVISAGLGVVMMTGYGLRKRRGSVKASETV